MPVKSPPATLNYDDAVISGHKRYLGKPCNQCGSADRLVSCKACYACHAKARNTWSHENRDRHKQMQKDWALRNRDHIATMRKNHTPLDPIERYKRKRRYQDNDPHHAEKRNAQRREHRKVNGPFESFTRRIRKLGGSPQSLGSFTKVEKLAKMLEREKGCAYCGTTDDLTLDHIISLASGGQHTMANFQWLCRSHNSQKHTKTHDEYVLWCIERDIPLPLIYCTWTPEIEIFRAVSPWETFILSCKSTKC